MIRILTLLTLVGVLSVGFAQQLPQYSQYNFNYYIQNPAIGGLDRPVEAQLGYRTQWVGFEGEPPRTTFVSVHGPVKFNDNRNVHHRAKPHHGLGAYVFQDKAGLLTYKGLNLSYSYHMNLTRKHKLSFGTFVGFKQYTLDASQVVFTQSPDYDPKLEGKQENALLPDASVGIWYYSDKLFVGLSSHQILRSSIDLSQNSVKGDFANLDYHYLLNAGRLFKINKWVKIIPSLLVKAVSPAPIQVDLTYKMLFDDKYSFFLSGRNFDALIAGVSARYEMLEIGYAFDLTTNALQQHSSGTHEIMLEVYLSPKKKVECPKFF